MTAARTLADALNDYRSEGKRTPCQTVSIDYWTHKDQGVRARAVKLCQSCPLLRVCRAAAEEQFQAHGVENHVWGGVDYTVRTRQAQRDRQAAARAA